MTMRMRATQIEVELMNQHHLQHLHNQLHWLCHHHHSHLPHSTLDPFHHLGSIPKLQNLPIMAKTQKPISVHLRVRLQKNEELAAHAVMAFDQVWSLKHHVNGKASKSKRRKLNTNVRWLNSEKGLVQCKREVTEAEAEGACKQARADEKQAEEEEQ
ncbi:hypothetical protein L208DRAFT_1505662, partial [Tricholoma matsutake]